MRTLIGSLDAQFADIDTRQRRLLLKSPEDRLFWTPTAATETLLTLSVGGAVLRSAAMVEQAFLGITRRLWDDPFEWTLPERLSTTTAVLEYLDEVAAARREGLSFLTSDEDLSRTLPAPEALKPIFQVLVEAIARSENFLGRGEAVARILSHDPSGRKDRPNA
jgi:hypothetical protein